MSDGVGERRNGSYLRHTRMGSRTVFFSRAVREGIRIPLNPSPICQTVNINCEHVHKVCFHSRLVANLHFNVPKIFVTMVRWLACVTHFLSLVIKKFLIVFVLFFRRKSVCFFSNYKISDMQKRKYLFYSFSQYKVAKEMKNSDFLNTSHVQ